MGLVCSRQRRKSSRLTGSSPVRMISPQRLPFSKEAAIMPGGLHLSHLIYIVNVSENKISPSAQPEFIRKSSTCSTFTVNNLDRAFEGHAVTEMLGKPSLTGMSEWVSDWGFNFVLINYSPGDEGSDLQASKLHNQNQYDGAFQPVVALPFNAKRRA